MELQEATLLVVEDDDSMRELLALWLTRAGAARVFAAEDGEQAIALLKDNPIDLVVSDLYMPHLDGFDLLNRLKSKDNRKPCVVLISGYLMSSIPWCEVQGADAIMEKPFDGSALIKAVRELLAPLEAHP